MMQVSGGSQSFNAVNQMRVLGRWMRMITIPNQSSVAKAYEQFDEDGRMKPSPYYDRVVDVVARRSSIPSANSIAVTNSTSWFADPPDLCRWRNMLRPVDPNPHGWLFKSQAMRYGETHDAESVIRHDVGVSSKILHDQELFITTSHAPHIPINDPC